MVVLVLLLVFCSAKENKEVKMDKVVFCGRVKLNDKIMKTDVLHPTEPTRTSYGSDRN